MSDEDLNEKKLSRLKREALEIEREVQRAKANIYNRNITPQEFYYLLSRYPYLQLCDANYPYVDQGTQVEILETECGWKVYNYRTLLASGCHELMAMLLAHEARFPEKKKEEDEGGSEGGASGSGTIVRQYSETAFEMMLLAKTLGWSAAAVVGGFYGMQRMAWVAGELIDYPLKGFEPTAEDYVVLRWTSSLYEGTLYPPKIPITTATPSKKNQ